MDNHSGTEDDAVGLDSILSPSHTKVPKWLEDLSDNVRKKRPGSLKMSHNSSPDLEYQASGVMPSQTDLSLSESGISALVEDLQLNERNFSRGSDILSPHREGSARHGRRAVTAGSRSAGNSPRKTPLVGPIRAPMEGEASVRGTYSAPRHRSETGSPTVYEPTVQSSWDGHGSRTGCRIEEHDWRELSLEESWSSLSFFDRRHKGRLTRKREDELASVGSPLNEGVELETEGTSSTSLGRSLVPEFIIPELPTGHQLDINIRSTWGDRHYLGLNGIEVFSSSGEPVQVVKIWAEPSDINVLPEYSKDPRIVKNLLDAVNRTHDDMHLWLAPFTPGTNHLIHMVFEHKVQVAMIRIWNYNKSRIHSYRGARDVEISLDGVAVFQGEIARACGGILGGTEAFGDTILFTTDDNILESISQFDDSFSNLLSDSRTEVAYQEVERPITADNGGERPFTSAGYTHPEGIPDEESCSGYLLGGQKVEISLLANWGHPALIGLASFEVVGGSGIAIPVEPQYLQCSIRSPDIYRLVDGVNVTTDESHMWNTGFLDSQPVVLTVTYPAVHYIAGIRIWNYNSSPDLAYCGVKLLTIHLDGKLVSPGCQGVVTVRRAPGNCHFNFAQDLFLIETSKPSSAVDSDGKITSILHSFSDHDMRTYPSLLPCSPRGIENVELRRNRDSQNHSATHDYPISVLSSGDGKHLGPASLALSPRGSMGNFLLSEDVDHHLRNCALQPALSSRVEDAEYEAPVMPQGFVFQLLILSTWGDLYYVGLNGLELYDDEGDRIRLSENNIGAFPDSVNILEGVGNDVRTPEKLVDSVNDTLDGRHMWLAPVLPNQLNRVYIVFDYPVTVSMIKLWNYAKTPNRGVKEFGILVDDLLVYNGVLDKVSSSTSNSLQPVKVPYRTVLFTSDKDLLRRERSTQVRHSSYGHHVHLHNDHQRVTSGGGSCHSADQSQRPLTSLAPNNRSRSLHNL